MEPWLLAFVVFVVLIAGVTQTVTGFGFALVSVPPLIAVLDPKVVVVMISLLALANSGMVLSRTWHAAPWRVVGTLLAASLLGMPAGLAVLLFAPADALRIGVGLAAVAMALLVASGRRLAGDAPAARAIAGATSGLLSTSTGMNGPPVVLYFADQGVRPDTFRGGLSAYFLASGLVSLAILSAGGVVTGRALALAAIALPIVFLGNSIGQALAGRIDTERFRTLVLALLIITALVAVGTATARIAG